MNVSQALGGSGCQTNREVPVRGPLEKGRSEVEVRRVLTPPPPAPLQDWSEVNLDFALWFILKLFVSLF